jgi:predicted ATPase
VFQDLHLYDTPSQELVAALATGIDTAVNPINVIVTHDPQLLLLWPETATLNVHALSYEEASTLAHKLFTEVGVACELEAYLEASAGVPLLLIELVRLAAIDPSIRPPRSLAEAINQRISRLPPRTRMLLHTMAVLGRPTRTDTVAEISGEDLAIEQRALSFLAEQGFLLSTKNGFRPSHRMHREVAYASIPVSLRQQLHAHAAELEMREDGPAAHIAHHLYHAGKRERAVPYLIRAGRRALYFLDDQLARKLFNRVLQLVPAPPHDFNGDRRPWLDGIIGLAGALHDGGETPQAVRLLKDASVHARKAGWEEQLTKLSRRLQELRDARDAA